MNTSLFNTTVTSELPVPENDDDFMFVRHLFGGVLGLFCPFIVIINLLVIVAILKTTKLRIDFRHLVIVSIAVSDFLIGLLVCPYELDRSINYRDRGRCHTYIPLEILESYVHVFVGLWGIAIINLHYLLDVTNRKPELSPLKSKCVAAFALIMPWVLSCIILPIAYSHGVLDVTQDEFNCYVSSSVSLLETIFVLSFVLPSSLILIQSLMIVMLYVKRSGLGLPTQAESGEGALPMKALIGASLATVFLMCSEAYVDSVQNFVRKTTMVVYISAHMVAATKPWIMPLVWLLSPGLRAAVKELLPRAPCRKIDQSQSQTGIVTYVNLLDEQGVN